MKKSFILALVAVFAAGAACASEVSPEQAREVAVAWSARNAAFGVSAADVGTPKHVADTNGVTLWYQVQMGTSCLIVAPVTEIEPVIAALENMDATEGLPAGHPMLAMLTRDMTDRLKKLGLYRPQAPSGGATLQGASLVSGATPEDPAFAAAWAEQGRARWAQLLPKGGARPMAAKEDGVTEINVQIGIVDGFEKGGRFTHWNQEKDAADKPCYNFYTPNHAVCGCVATSMGAMMQFFAVTGCVADASCPDGLVCETQDGIKGATYNGVGEGMYKTRGGVYDWSLFSNNVDRASYNALTDAQRELLGRVAYDCGVAVAMQWTSGESSAYVMDVAPALRTVFGFKDARAVFLPTEEQYAKLIYHQCRAGAPVQLGIHGSGGHSVLAVGYGTDDEGVPRVRIFTGWGGSGDGWYALPYITTASVPGGGSHFFDVIQQIVTMIGYDSDETVPVVGHMDAPGEAIQVPGASRTIHSNENGYFGTRVAPSLSDKRLVCRGKEATFEIGADAAGSEDEYTVTDAAALCDALPDEIEFLLLNSSVAYTLARAKEIALAEGKAVLRVSGTVGDTNTQAVLDYIYALDDTNAGDFTNRFVYIYSDAGSTAGDMSPSIGVYLPQEMDANDRWLSSNGMLTYEWRMSATNGVEDLQATVQSVLEVGWDLYQRRSGNTKLTIVTPTFEQGTPLFKISYEGATNTVEETPATGEYVNAFKDGQTVTVESLCELTNETAGVVLACSGWTLTNETTGAVTNGRGTKAELLLTTNATFSLHWSVKTNAVYVNVAVYYLGGGGSKNKVTPGSGWYPYGQSVTFTAVPDTANDFVFVSWVDGPSWADDPEESGHVAGVSAPGVSAAGLMLVSDCLAPVSVQANFREGSASDYAPPETNTVKVFSYAYETNVVDGEVFASWTNFADVATVPETTVVAVPGQIISLTNGASAAVPAITVGFAIQSPVVDATGGVWRCMGWRVKETGDHGFGSGAGIKVSEDMTLWWVWEREVVEEDSGREEKTDEELAPVPPEEKDLLTIYSNADGTLTVEANVFNGYAGYWYSLYAADELDGEWDIVDNVQVYEGIGWICPEKDGEVNLRITFEPSDAKCFYKVVVDREDPTE